MTMRVDPELEAAAGEKLRSIRMFGREFILPQSRLVRVVIGGVLVVLGCFGFLPILGFWMIPLGLLILSYEFAMIRRWRRRFVVGWGRRNGRRNGKARNGSAPSSAGRSSPSATTPIVPPP